MRISPMITLGLSVTFGVAAILVARQFTKSGDEADPIEMVETVKEATQPVVVAVEGIARGDIIEGVVLAVEYWPESQLPYGHFASVDEIGSTQYSPRKAMTAISVGEPVLDSRLSPSGMRPSLAGRLEPGFRAYTISMNDISGVAGFVLPGDRIDIIYTKKSHPNSRNTKVISEVFMSNVEVLGVGLNDDLRTDQPAEFQNATLAVTLDDAQRLSVASQNGRLSMALRSTRDKDTVVVAAAAPIKPRVRRYRPVVRVAKKPKFETVQVILGETKTDYTVPSNVQP